MWVDSWTQFLCARVELGHFSWNRSSHYWVHELSFVKPAKVMLGSALLHWTHCQGPPTRRLNAATAGHGHMPYNCATGKWWNIHENSLRVSLQHCNIPWIMLKGSRDLRVHHQVVSFSDVNDRWFLHDSIGFPGRPWPLAFCSLVQALTAMATL